ncbi:hypothetical protein C2S52_014715 [Perilla frutescens var. hirtella]|nr:hypothetical protein C2S52_014715 [Perilla frutescens var. hirtella]
MISRTTKDLEETMKTMILSPNSSAKSTTTMESNPSEKRESFYFPGCKKDANCNCEICIASFNATLDLMPPQSAHRSSLTKLSVLRSKLRRSPVLFPSSADVSTPMSSPTMVSPPRNPNASMNFQERQKKELKYEGLIVRFLLGLALVYGLEYGFSWMVSEGLKTQLWPELVRNMADNSRVREDLNGRFLFLKNELEGFVGNRVSSCSSVDSVWKISQDGLLLNSRCVLYESMAEEVSIWGWPLQTAGLLTAEYSSRSFSIITGRVAEWSSDKASYFVRAANSSWEQAKWSSSVVQFDPNTWILEYRQSFLVENAKPVSAALKFLTFRLTNEFDKMRQEFWLPSPVLGRGQGFKKRTILTPT